MFRHGDRTPINTYPNDPYKDPSNWERGWGQLTNLGKQHHYELGQWLRKRYNGLIGDIYTPEDIYIRSTDIDRTLMSAQANLAGLYAPKGKDIWNPDIAWQPIPVHTEKEKHDKLLAMKKPCPAYETAYKALLASEEFKRIRTKYSQLFEYLTEQTGEKIDSLERAQYLYSALFIEQHNNMTLPDWTKTVFPEPLSLLSSYAFASQAYTRVLARLKSGPLLKDILSRFLNKTQGTLKPDRSMRIYSAHDTTVANLLNTLRLFELHNPPFRACVLLELREFENNHYVSVFYKNSSAEPTLFTIPDCGVACPLDQMFKIYKDVLPIDWDTECLQPPIMETLIAGQQLEFGSTLVVLIAASTVMMISLLLFGFAALYYRRREYVEKKWYHSIDG